MWPLSIITVLIAVSGVFLYTEVPGERMDTVEGVPTSVEIGVSELSPRGEEGGYAIPASGESTCTLNVSPSTITQGQTVTLSWTNGDFATNLNFYRYLNAAAPEVQLGSHGSGWVDASAASLPPGNYLYAVWGNWNFSPDHDLDGISEENYYRCSAWLTVTGPTATCSANKTTALTDEAVTWTAVVTGGVAPYTYEWQRGDGRALGTGNPLVFTYDAIGPKNAQVIVTDSNLVKTPLAICSNNVIVTLPPPVPTYSCSANGTSVTFNYATAGATEYFLRFDNDMSAPHIDVLDDRTSSTWTKSGITPGQTYNFWVHAGNGGGSWTTDISGAGSISFSCPAPNLPPTANAGPDKAITLPTSDSAPTGASASDSDGSVASTVWTFVSGPSTPTIGSGSTLSPTLTSLTTVGTYVFRLTATDNGGLTAMDTMQVVVSPAPNLPDLTSNSLIISAAPYTQGTALTVTGVARNVGSVTTGVAFSDNITYRWGTGGAWLDSPGNTFTKPALNPVTNASADILSFTPTQAGTDLYFQHCVDSAIPDAVDESNETNNCQVIGPYMVQPPAPTGLTATPQACGTGQVNLSWNTVAGASSYDIGKDGVVTTLGNVLATTHTGLTAGSNHAYRVRVTSGGATSAWSAIVNQTAPAVCVQPDLVSTLFTKTVGGNSVPTYTPLAFTGSVQNNGTGATGVGFVDRYYYSFNGGTWVSGGNINKAALNVGASSADGTFNFTPTSPGTYDFYHCVDQTNTVFNESNEANNCSAPIRVLVTSTPTTCSVSPTTAAIGQLVTWTATQPIGGFGAYTYTWGGSVSGNGITLTTSYATAGVKTARVSAADSLGQQFGTNVACTNSVTVVPGSFPNLISQNFTVSNGPYAQGTPINLTARVRNTGSVSTGVPFRDNFTVQWGGTSGSWSPVIATINQPTLAENTTSATPDTAVYTPAQAGNVYFQHCVDSANNVNEDTNETPNCVILGPYVVPPPPLQPPTGLTATPGACGTGAITVTWDPVVGATAYQLYEGATLLHDSSTRSFSHTGLAMGSSHTYTVRASNANGASALSAPVSATTAAACPRPDLISLNHIRTDGGAGTVVLGTALSFSAQVRNQGPIEARNDTTPIPGNFSDRFQYSTNEGATWATIRSRTQTPLAAMTTSATTDTSGSFTPLTSGTYRIRHCADIGAVVTESNETNNCTETDPVIVIGPDVTCSVSPASANISENVTWTAAGTGGIAPYTYQWVVYPGESDSPAGATNPFIKSYSTIGDKHAQVQAWDSLGVPTPLRSCTNFVTVNAGNLPDLVSQNFTVEAGPYVQGTSIDLTANVRNAGTVTTGGSFQDNFTVQWDGMGGAWSPVIATINQPTLAALTTSTTTDTAAYTPTRIGKVYFQHCVDSNTDIDEGAETPNCVQKGPYTVTNPGALTATCSVSPTRADVGDNVTWTALGANGTTPYEYRWVAVTGESDSPATGWTSSNSIVESYATEGFKHAQVQIRDSAIPRLTSPITTCTNAVDVDDPTGLLPASVVLEVSTFGTGAKPRTTNDITIIAGEEVHLWWDGTNVTSCGGIGFLTGTTDPEADQPNVNEPVTGSRTYQVQCSGSGTPDPALSNAIVVTKLGPPTIVVPPRVRRGDTIQITGNTGGSTNCTLEGTNVETNGDNSVDLTGISGPFPTETTGNINETTTFSIECGAAGRDEGTVTILGTFEEV